MTFDEFVAKEHQRRVKHFVAFVRGTGQAPSVRNAIEIFGFVAKDVKPIVADAILILNSEA